MLPVLRLILQQHASSAREPQLQGYREVLNTYRPPGQKSWSKALVRHGSDALVALAAVLGIAAEDIQAREPAGTGAGRHPSNPKAGRLLSVIGGQGG